MQIKNKLFSFKFYWILILFFILFFISQWINGRFWMNDFKVYFLAMQNFLENKPIYGIPFGLESGFYKYTPIALLPFSVFYFISFEIAAIIYYSIISAVILIVLYKLFYLFTNLFKINYEKKGLIIFLSTIVLINHFYRELHLGNLNILLLFLYIVSFEYLVKDKKVLAGVLMGIGLLFKLHFIILLPVLLIFKKFKSATFMILTFITGLFLPITIVGLDSNNKLLYNWFVAMKGHNQSIYNSADTIYAWVNKVMKLINFEQENMIFPFIVLIIFASSFLLFFYIKDSDLIERYKVKSFSFVYFLAIACIPILTVTDSEHFLFSLPIIMLSIFILFYQKKLSKIIFGLILMGFVFYGGNWHDLWGHRISVYFIENGFLGLGNIIIIFVIAYFWAFKKVDFTS